MFFLIFLIYKLIMSNDEKMKKRIEKTRRHKKGRRLKKFSEYVDKIPDRGNRYVWKPISNKSSPAPGYTVSFKIYKFNDE